MGSNKSVAVSYSIQNFEKVVGGSVALRRSCGMDLVPQRPTILKNSES